MCVLAPFDPIIESNCIYPPHLCVCVCVSRKGRCCLEMKSFAISNIEIRCTEDRIHKKERKLELKKPIFFCQYRTYRMYIDKMQGERERERERGKKRIERGGGILLPGYFPLLSLSFRMGCMHHSWQQEWLFVVRIELLCLSLAFSFINLQNEIQLDVFRDYFKG